MSRMPVHMLLLCGAFSLLISLPWAAGSEVHPYFSLYTDAWTKQHQSWIGDKSNAEACASGVVFPTCIAGRTLDLPHGECVAMKCIDTIKSHGCIYTPQDTTDYVPPPVHVDKKLSICTAGGGEGVTAEVSLNGYGLDEGIPPLFMPLHAIPLVITGFVHGDVNGRECTPVQNASMDVWQLDPAAYADTGFDTTSMANSDDATLRQNSCRGRRDAQYDGGAYRFTTTMPPSYGPPRHVNFMVAADGYETLITRMYFDADRRLHQLTVLSGMDDAESVVVEGGDPHDWFASTSTGYHRGFDTDDEVNRGSENNLRSRFPGPLGRDPRIATLKFVNTSAHTAGGRVTGYFHATFNVVLRPLRVIDASSNTVTTTSSKASMFAKVRPDGAANDDNAKEKRILPLNITGYWADMTSFSSFAATAGGSAGGGVSSGGGLIKVDSFGNRFIAIEYPHPRNWGTVTGIVIGDVIHGVDFRTSHIISARTNTLPMTAANGMNPPNAPNRPASTRDTEIMMTDYDIESIKTYRNSIRGVDRKEESRRLATNAQGERIDIIDRNENDDDVNIIYDIERLEEINNVGQHSTLDIPSETLQSSDLSTGIIVNKDPTSSSPYSRAIHWYGNGGYGGVGGQRGGYAGMWSRVEDVRPYRYLKLKIVRETGGYNGKLVINEIRFYGGVQAQTEFPTHDFKMKTPRTPFPQVVSCSGFQDQNTHCYKAFDGIDDRPDSAWVTKPVGSHSHNLAEPQWVVLDLGLHRGAFPTAVRITCDVGNSGSYGATTADPTGTSAMPKGCPMTFSVLASYDNIKYDVMYTKNMYDYVNEYGTIQAMQLASMQLSAAALEAAANASLYSTSDDDDSTSATVIEPTVTSTSAAMSSNDGVVRSANSIANAGKVPIGLMFDFFWEAPTGYPSGHKCGSCSMPPLFSCNLNAFDGTCATGFCAYNGICNEIPDCPVGHYMQQQFSAYDKPVYKCLQCPAGRYGDSTKLKDPKCSGPCKEGHYCPIGSTSPTARPCGSIHVFCPVASAAPVRASSGWKTITGIYPINNSMLVDPVTGAAAPAVSKEAVQQAVYYEDTSVRSAEVLCDEGHYCMNGVQYPCPIGTYGNSSGLQTPDCTDRCVAGEYCPEGSVVPTICPKGHYCPDGEVRYPCPAGTFGGMVGLRAPTCSGLCRVGYYCPQGSVTSASVAQQCPAGRYGSTPGLASSDCSGQCAAGHYCPVASVSATARMCGHVNVYCPVGSATPLPVTDGFYSTEGVNASMMAAQSICERGFYCTRGVKYACPVGTYGEIEGLSLNLMSSLYREHNGLVPVAPNDTLVLDGTLSIITPPTTAAPTSQPTFNSVESSQLYATNAKCSGYCAHGFFCPLNSTTPHQVPCPAGRYGNREGLTDEMCTAVCPLGHYCPSGSVLPTPCPAGIFGNITGLTSARCNPYCYDSEMTMTTQVLSTLTDAAKSSSIVASEGVVASLQQVQQQQLTSSAFNNDNCRENLCDAGYYCTVGSISAREHECGSPDVYCPMGSSEPTPVSEGYYTITASSSSAYRVLSITGTSGSSSIAHDRDGELSLDLAHVRTTQLVCDKGHFCVGGVRYPCPAGVYGETVGLTSAACTAPCPVGYYCPESTIDKFQFRCPAGRYGSTTGLTDSSCSGVCATGHYCPEQSTSPTQIRCGQNLTQPNSVFCYEGSTRPSVVHPGFYSVGNDMYTRDDEVACPLGAYCVDGVIYDCPAGRYGRATRMETPQCSGACQKGFYCPPASTSRNEIPCPKGRFGATEGLGNQMCTGACQNPYYCPLGSVESTVKATEKAGNIW